MTLSTGARLVDLHPDDLNNRIILNAQLTGLRLAGRWTAKAYAEKLEVTTHAVWYMEHADLPNPQIHTIERRAALVHRRLVISLHHLPEFEDDPEIAMLAARRPTSVEHRSANTVTLLITRLNAARVAMGVTVDELAGRLGISQSGVSKIHSESTPSLRLSTGQRYARAIGGHLTFTLERIEAGR